MPTALHEERLDAVLQTLLSADVRTVLDLGCGFGELLERLLGAPQFVRIVGIDTSADALAQARRRLPRVDRLSLRHASYAEYDPELAGFDAATLVETIEHIDPDRLSAVESAVFRGYRPRLVVITTPNRDYNPLLGLPEGRLRHRGHRFEWARAKFQTWAKGIARRNGYQPSFHDIGGSIHPILGGPTQMARFARCSRVPAVDAGSGIDCEARERHPPRFAGTMVGLMERA
jgi:small RNA 2'-O-methyltransferase